MSFSYKHFDFFHFFLLLTSSFASIFCFSLFRSSKSSKLFFLFFASCRLAAINALFPLPPSSTLQPRFQCLATHSYAVGVSHHTISLLFYTLRDRGSTVVSLFLQKLLRRNNVTILSRTSFKVSYFSLPSQSIALEVLITAVVSGFRCV